MNIITQKRLNYYLKLEELVESLDEFASLLRDNSYTSHVLDSIESTINNFQNQYLDEEIKNYIDEGVNTDDLDYMSISLIPNLGTLLSQRLRKAVSETERQNVFNNLLQGFTSITDSISNINDELKELGEDSIDLSINKSDSNLFLRFELAEAHQLNEIDDITSTLNKLIQGVNKSNTNFSFKITSVNEGSLDIFALCDPDTLQLIQDNWLLVTPLIRKALHHVKGLATYDWFVESNEESIKSQLENELNNLPLFEGLGEGSDVIKGLFIRLICKYLLKVIFPKQNTITEQKEALKPYSRAEIGFLQKLLPQNGEVNDDTKDKTK